MSFCTTVRYPVETIFELVDVSSYFGNNISGSSSCFRQPIKACQFYILVLHLVEFAADIVYVPFTSIYPILCDGKVHDMSIQASPIYGSRIFICRCLVGYGFRNGNDYSMFRFWVFQTLLCI